MFLSLHTRRRLEMTIGKPIRCYPLKKKDGKFVYLPYDKTEFDITFVGDDTEIKAVQEYWQAIQKPEYNPRDRDWETTNGFTYCHF